MTQPQPDRLPEQTPNHQPVTGAILPHEDMYEPLPERRGCSGCAWGVAGMLGCLVLLVAPIIGLLIGGTITLNGLIGSIGSVFSPRPAVASVVSTQTIVNSIQPMGQLVSISAQLAKADIFVGVQQGALNACGFSANHVAQGAVEAGIDLNAVTEDNIRYDEAADTYTITVPPAQLTSCRIDFIRQYERSVTACAVDWDEARLLANYLALIEFRDDAVEGGILRRAENEARIALSNFVTALTGSKVNIVFQQPEGDPVIPPSCQPQPPQGWSYDASLNAWIQQ